MSSKIKTLRVTLSCVLLICSIFFLLKIFAFWGETDSQILYGNEKSFADEKNIYVINEQTGNIHIFDYNGTFLKRLRLPVKGGIIWVTMSDALKAYCVRSNMLISIADINSIEQQEAYYSNPKEFYSSFDSENSIESEIEKNIVTLGANTTPKKVVLDIKTSIFSLDFCMILYAVCLIAFFAISGLFKKWLKRY